MTIGVRSVTWDNLNPGWRFECICGWQSRETSEVLSVAADILEDHWKADHDEGAA